MHSVRAAAARGLDPQPVSGASSPSALPGSGVAVEQVAAGRAVAAALARRAARGGGAR